MKRGAITILALTLLTIQTFGQSVTSVSFLSTPLETSNESESYSETDLFFLSAENMDKEEIATYREELGFFIDKMSLKREKVNDQKYFLKNLFYKVHNKYLKNYKNLVMFDELFKRGYYDCVSGTALYALILDELEFEYEVYESNFHVLLLVQLENDVVLFESTDFNSGFVDDEDQINRRIDYYQSLNEQESDDYYNYQENTNRTIDSKQLAGLLFYNLAVKEYNQQNLKVAAAYLDKAEILYKGHRTAELRNLISNMTLAANSYPMQ